MNSPRFGLRVASALAAMIGIAHLLRFVTELEIKLGSWRVGLWLSGVAIVAAAALSYWFRQLAEQADDPRARP